MITAATTRAQERRDATGDRSGCAKTWPSRPRRQKGWLAGRSTAVMTAAPRSRRLATAGGHEQADLFLVRGPAVERRDQLAAIHDRDPVGQLEDLVELGRDEQDRRSGVTHLDRPAMDEFDAADVEPARRLVENKELGGAAELARHDGLLLVAARKRVGRDGRRGCSDVVLLDEFLCPCVIAASWRTGPRANGGR